MWHVEARAAPAAATPGRSPDCRSQRSAGKASGRNVALNAKAEKLTPLEILKKENELLKRTIETAEPAGEPSRAGRRVALAGCLQGGRGQRRWPQWLGQGPSPRSERFG